MEKTADGQESCDARGTEQQTVLRAASRDNERLTRIARLMGRWRMERAEKRETSRLVTGGDGLFLQGSTDVDRWTGNWMIRTKALQGSREGDSQRTKDSSTHELMQRRRPGTRDLDESRAAAAGFTTEREQ